MGVQPSHVLRRPFLFDLVWCLGSVSQQKLSQPLTCSLLVLFSVFPRSYQIAQYFVGRIRDPHRRQIAIAITPRQLLGIPPVGLDPIARFGRHQRTARSPRSSRPAVSTANTERTRSDPLRSTLSAASPDPALPPLCESIPGGSGSPPESALRRPAPPPPSRSSPRGHPNQ